MVLFEPEGPKEELLSIQNQPSSTPAPIPQQPKEQSAQSLEAAHRQLTAPLP